MGEVSMSFMKQLFTLIMMVLIGQGLSAQDSSQNKELGSLGERRRNLPARVGPNVLKGHDLAEERQKWALEWFGNSSLEYLDAVNKIAEKEVSKYRSKVPVPVFSGSSATLTYPLLGGAIGSLGGGTWTNIGPFGNLIDSTWPDHDTGRVTRIAPHPNWPTTPTLYVAFSGGGVFKCTNADPAAGATGWSWVSITDSLPATSSDGNQAVGALAIDPNNGNTLYLGLGDHVDGEGRGFYKSIDGGATWFAATGLGSATRSYDILVMNDGRIFWATNDGLKVSSSNTSSTLTFVSVGVTEGITGQVWTIKKLNESNLVCSVKGSAGTIFYSTNGGSTWASSSIQGVTGSILRITLAAVASKVVGIFETGSGISKGLLVSTNGGSSFTYQAQTGSGATGLFYASGGSSDGGQDWYNQLLTIDPNNGNNIFVAANLALYRSQDGGLTWQQMTHWYGGGKVYMHADHHTAAWSSNGQILLIGTDGGFAILRDPFRAVVPSATGTTSVPADITFVDHRRNFGLATHLIYNLGSTNATTPLDSKYRVVIGLQDNGTRVRQAVANTGLLGSTGPLQNSGIFEDTIGGDGFSSLIHPENGNLMLGSLYYTRIYKSTNGGTSAFSSSSTGIVGSGSNSTSPFYPKMHLGNSIAPDSVYTQTNYVLYKSGNFGSSWSALPMTGYPTNSTIRNFHTSEANQALHVIVGGNGTFYKARIPELNNDAVVDALDLLVVAKHHGSSTATANKWADVNGDGNVGDSDITATIGVLDGAVNNVATWTQLGGTANPALNNSWVWIDTTNEQIMYIGSVTRNLGATGLQSKLYKSTNGGTTWSAIGGASSGLPFGVPVHVIKNIPGDGTKLFCGTDFGIYYSEDSGNTWVRYGAGLPLVAVRDIYIAPDKSFIRIATYGRGVWEINNPTYTASE
jgi:hypothetical protein